MKDRRIALGLHVGHDRCAAIVVNGIVVAAVAEERLDRRKHSPADTLPILSYRYVVEAAGLIAADIDIVVITHSGCPVSGDIEESWRREICLMLARVDLPVIMLGHHLAHAYAAYFTSPFDRAAIMVADGGGDTPTESVCEAESFYVASENCIDVIHSRFQHNTIKFGTSLAVERFDYLSESNRSCQISIGKKYQQITQLLGFKFGQSGKTMGLAPYGKPFLELPVRVSELDIDLTYADYLRQLHGACRDSALPYSSFLRLHRADIAHDIQAFTVEALLSLLRNFQRRTGERNLCLAGGVFLNCLANERIRRSCGFDEIYIVPPAGDDGQAIGAAIYGYISDKSPSPRVPQHFSAFLGRSYGRLEALVQLAQFDQPHCAYDNLETLLDKLAYLLASGAVIGICLGRSEVGPRALGHRSILASPLAPGMRDFINRKVKYREDFRPFAPVVLADRASEFFDLSVASPHMLLAAPVRPEYREHLVGVTHVDGSARIQTVTMEDDSFLYKLLDRFGDITRFPILINTSFNMGDEPIVETPRDALLTFRQTELHYLVLDDVLVWKRDPHPG